MVKEFFAPLHTRTKRKYIERMLNDKVHCMEKASQFEFDYWDGDRKYGYGGYLYDGRWKAVAEQIIREYSLTNSSSVLDVGCGKAHLLYEISLLVPGISITGIDVSKYALDNLPEDIKGDFYNMKADEEYPFKDDQFDLVLSLGALHNLPIDNLGAAFAEINRVSLQQYVLVESYRNSQELFNLQCWALTCKSFFSTQEWIWVFNNFQYKGDYEFIFFQ